MHEIKFVAKQRSDDKKAKDFLREGLIPAVVYGPDFEATSVAIDKVDVMRVIGNIVETTPIVLELENGEEKEVHAFLKAVQRNKITDAIMHMDFFVPAKGHRMEVRIPLNFIGIPAGVEKGGIVEHIYNEIPVAVLPADLVEQFDINVENLGLGAVLRVKDLGLPATIKPLLELDEPVFVVESPRLVEVEEPEEEGTQPQVIEKAKKEEEEA